MICYLLLKKSRGLTQRRNKILNYTDLINTVCLSSTVQWHEAQTEVYSLLPSGDLCPCWFILYLKHNIICKSRNGLWSGLHVCLWKEKNEESQGMQFSCKWSILKSILGKKRNHMTHSWLQRHLWNYPYTWSPHTQYKVEIILEYLYLQQHCSISL